MLYDDECDCECHTNASVLHFMACCEGKCDVCDRYVMTMKSHKARHHRDLLPSCTKYKAHLEENVLKIIKFIVTKGTQRTIYIECKDSNMKWRLQYGKIIQSNFSLWMYKYKDEIPWTLFYIGQGNIIVIPNFPKEYYNKEFVTDYLEYTIK